MTKQLLTLFTSLLFSVSVFSQRQNTILLSHELKGDVKSFSTRMYSYPLVEDGVVIDVGESILDLHYQFNADKTLFDITSLAADGSLSSTQRYVIKDNAIVENQQYKYANESPVSSKDVRFVEARDSLEIWLCTQRKSDVLSTDTLYIYVRNGGYDYTVKQQKGDSLNTIVDTRISPQYGVVEFRINDSEHNRLQLINTFDETGLMIRTNFYDFDDTLHTAAPKYFFTYKYTELDNHNNWIERLTYNSAGDIWAITRRTISYFAIKE